MCCVSWFLGIDLKKIADSMTNASGAEIKGVCTEAGMFALRERRVHVTQDDFEMAVAKVMHKDSKDSYFNKLFKWALPAINTACRSFDDAYIVK